jgi:beta-N-acetylhexosaminidase/D-alanyl-D-alanine dipeptidase
VTRTVAGFASVLPGLLFLLACGSRRPLGPPAPDAGAATAAPLVDLAAVAPTIRLDLRYATTNNFTGQAVYPTTARCLLRAPVAAALARVQAALARQGLGLQIWDCYRPFSVQKTFWALVPDPRYVARPVERDGRPVEGSRHNRGAAVDLTLVDGDGNALEMPTAFDDFSEHAHRAAVSWTELQRRNARLLEDAMTAEGFSPLPTEWWHFDGPQWERYPLTDLRVEVVPSPHPVNGE